MPVRQRGNRFEAAVNNQRLPNGRVRKLFPSRQQAEQWEQWVIQRLAAGDSIPEITGRSSPVSGPATVGELAEIVIKARWDQKRGCRTTAGNARQCAAMLGENLSLGSLTLERIDALIYEFRSQGNSETTINRKMTSLRVMINYAVDRGWMPRTIKIPHSKEVNGRIRYISPEEEAEMLAYFRTMAQPDMVDIVIVGIDTGLRTGEILALEKRDIDGDLIAVWQTKNGRPRSVPMTSRVKAVMSARSDSAVIGKLFPCWTHSMLRYRWDQARGHMGLLNDKQFVPHAMRHTFCSRLVQRGVDISAVSQLAGHTTLQMTMRYAHLAPRNLADAISKLNP